MILLKNINAYSVLELNNKKIIFFGEFHGQKTKCKASQTLFDFCIERIKKNKKARILLEYCPFSYCLKIHDSKSDIISSFLKFKDQSQVIPYDLRTFMLGDKNEYQLYNHKNLSMKEPFISSFFNKIWLLDINSNLYSQDSYRYLLKYVSDLKNTFSSVKNISDIKEAWKKVTDFFILKEILQANPDINEFIVISGMKHFENLNHIFNLKPVFKNRSNCLTILLNNDL